LIQINWLLLLQSSITGINDKETQRHILNWKNCENNKRSLYHTILSLTWTLCVVIFINTEYPVIQDSRMALLKLQSKAISLFQYAP